MNEAQRQALIQIGLDALATYLKVRELLLQAGATDAERQALDVRLKLAIAEDEAERAARPQRPA